MPHGVEQHLPEGVRGNGEPVLALDSPFYEMPGERQSAIEKGLKDEYDNGEPYFPYDGRELWLPPNPRERPGRELLEWHGDVVFLG